MSEEMEKNIIAEVSAITDLINAQSDMGKALKDKENPHFRSKYADLASVQSACLEPLRAHNFAVFQPCGRDQVGDYVDTIFAHKGGRMFTSRIYLEVDKKNMQGLGSAITYARRYGLMGLSGIAPEDDDGNAAAQAPNRTAEAIQDAWEDGIRDSLPQNATQFQIAEAYADAICIELTSKKSISGLDNVWTKRQKYISNLQNNEAYADFMNKVIDAYENTKNTITENKAA